MLFMIIESGEKQVNNDAQSA